MDAQTLQTFTFEVTQIRTILDDNGDPLFCLADVCKAIDLQNPTHAANQIKEEFELPTLNVGSFDTGYGIKNFTMITEPQLYFVMMRSRAKIARQFRQWIVNEVLPALRKHGHYEVPRKVENEFTSKEMQIISDFIYRCSIGIGWDQSFRDGCWYRLRKLTGVKSPNKFRYSDVKIIVNELTRLRNISDYYLEVRCRAEQEIIKRIVREGDNNVELFKILNEMTVKVTDDNALEKIRSIGSKIDQNDLLTLQQAS